MHLVCLDLSADMSAPLCFRSQIELHPPWFHWNDGQNLHNFLQSNISWASLRRRKQIGLSASVEWFNTLGWQISTCSFARTYTLECIVHITSYSFCAVTAVYLLKTISTAQCCIVSRLMVILFFQINTGKLSATVSVPRNLCFIKSRLPHFSMWFMMPQHTLKSQPV